MKIERRNARKFILKNLRSDRLMVADVIVDDETPTACINLITHVVNIGWEFLRNTVRDMDDLVFLIKHEVMHRYIFNQWNAQRFLAHILYRHTTQDVNWALEGAAEDAFINNYLSATGTCKSDFPDYYYKKKDHITTWLCRKGSGGFEFNRRKHLRELRKNRDFFIDLEFMAKVYWYMFQEDEKAGGKNSYLPMPISSVDDPIPSGTTDKKTSIIDQANAMIKYRRKIEDLLNKQQVGSRGRARRLQELFVPDINRDMDLSEIFNLKTPQMDMFTQLISGKDNLMKLLTGAVERSRNMGAEVYTAIVPPPSFSRHDAIMVAASSQPQVQFQHKPPEMERKKILWNIYVDVSASMDKEIPLSRFVAGKLKDIRNDMFIFSVGEPLPYDGQCVVYHSFGTDMVQCFIHCAHSRINHMLIIGDAEDEGYEFEFLPPDVALWAKKAETLMLITKPPRYHPVECYRRAEKTFKYVYHLRTNQLIKRGS